MKHSSEIDELIEGLEITSETLTMAAESLPYMFMRVAQFRTDRMRELAAAEMAVEKTRAETDQRMRRMLKGGDEKVTEPQIKARVDLNTHVIDATVKYHDANAASELSKLLLEAWRIKRDCLKVLSDLTAAERSSDATARLYTEKLAEARNRASRKYERT